MALSIAMGLVCCQQNPYRQGERLYEIHCASCHMSDGHGLAKLYPPLVTEDFSKYALTFSCIVRYGLADTIAVNGSEFSFEMPAIPQLNEVEISNIYNYIIHRWHPSLEPIHDKEVENQLKLCTK